MRTFSVTASTSKEAHLKIARSHGSRVVLVRSEKIVSDEGGPSIRITFRAAEREAAEATRRGRLLTLVLGAAALAVAAAIVTILWSVGGDAGLDSIGGADIERPALAIIHFENKTGDASLDHWGAALADLLTTDLAQSRFISVAGGETVFGALADLGLLEAASYSDDDVRRFGECCRARYVLTGSLIKAGEDFRITTKLHEPSAGRVVSVGELRGRGEESLFRLVDELTTKLKLDLGLSEQRIADDIDRNIGEITTSSIHALKLFSEALTHHFRDDYDLAVSLTKKAVVIDPEFGMAYMIMAYAYMMQGMQNEAFRAISKARECSERLSERERLFIRGTYYLINSEADDKALEAFAELLELYPDDFWGNERTGRLYISHFFEPEKAIPFFKRALWVSPRNDWLGQYTGLALSYQNTGRFDEAEATLKSGLEFYPQSIYIRGYLISYFLCRGDSASAREVVEEAARIGPAHQVLPLLVAQDIIEGKLVEAEDGIKLLAASESPALRDESRAFTSAILLTRGRLREGAEMILNDAAARENPTTTSCRQIIRAAQIYMHLGALERAQELVDAGIVQLETLDVRGIDDVMCKCRALLLKGSTSLELGGVEEAERALRQLGEYTSRLPNKHLVRYRLHLEAEIQAHNGQHPRALQLLENARRHYMPSQFDAPLHHSAARAAFAVGDYQAARFYLESIAESLSVRTEWAEYQPLALYLLGRALEADGDEEAAAEHYSRFLGFWDDADPELPQPEDARRRLTALAGVQSPSRQ